MTTRTLEQNLGVLRILRIPARSDLVGQIQQLPKPVQATAAAVSVHCLAPAHAAILDAADADLPALVGRLISEEVQRCAK